MILRRAWMEAPLKSIDESLNSYCQLDHDILEHPDASQHSTMKLLIAIPALNEEDSIQSIITRSLGQIHVGLACME